ncbi:MAG: heavy metal-responsive transcriptional regulator [Thermodesulfobacteriota bacterium]
MNGEFTIGVLARSAGVNIQTVRYYERRGLFSPVGRTPAGYRLYDEGSVKRLKFIRRAKDIGFTLEEIQGLLDLSLESEAVCVQVKGRTVRKLKTVEERIAALESVRKVLQEMIVACDRRRPTEKCPILKTMEEDKRREGV